MKPLSILFMISCLAFNLHESPGQIVSDQTNHIKLDFSKETSTILPHVIWEYPKLEYTNSEKNRLNIKSSVNSQVPLKSVQLIVRRSLEEDPVTIKTINTAPGATDAQIEMNIRLMEGQNYLQIVAENIEGGIVTDTRSITIGMDALKDAIAIDRKDYAILFATDKFDNWSDLVNPIYDATTIASELEDRFGFEVQLMENIDQDDVFTTLKEYGQKKYKPQDQLFIFFAGHGQYDETFGEGYVVARNSLRNDPGKNSYISHNRLRNNINNIPCEHIFLAMDVCFGGTFDPVLASSRAVYDEVDNIEFMVKKLSIKTRKYLTSGGKEYVSDGIRGQHSPFAAKLLEALKTNGGEDRLLTLTELNVFMEKLQTTPRFGAFGSDEQGSEFLFIAK